MKTTAFAGDLLKLLLQNSAAGSVAAVGSGLQAAVTAGSLYLSLHSADPGAAGSQTTSEASYTGYGRVAVARASGATGWTLSGAVASLGQLTGFGACTAAGQTLTHWGIGTSATLAGNLLYSGPIGSNRGSGTVVASTDVFTIAGYTPANGDQVSFEATVGGSFPTGVTAGTVYFAVSVSGKTLKVSTTLGGSAVDVTADGDFSVFQHTPFVVTSAPSYTPQLTTGTQVQES